MKKQLKVIEYALEILDVMGLNDTECYDEFVRLQSNVNEIELRTTLETFVSLVETSRYTMSYEYKQIMKYYNEGKSKLDVLISSL